MPKCPEEMPLLKKKWCERPSYYRAKISPLEGCNEDKNYTIRDG